FRRHPVLQIAPQLEQIDLEVAVGICEPAEGVDEVEGEGAASTAPLLPFDREFIRSAGQDLYLVCVGLLQIGRRDFRALHRGPGQLARAAGVGYHDYLGFVLKREGGDDGLQVEKRISSDDIRSC